MGGIVGRPPLENIGKLVPDVGIIEAKRFREDRGSDNQKESNQCATSTHMSVPGVLKNEEMVLG
jgi:hypothetical protein